MEQLAIEIASLIRQIKAKTGCFISVGTVESATGGRVADKLTNIPGSSDFFYGAVVSYSNELKTNLVSLNPDTLSTFGAVSAEAASEMAQGGRTLLGTDICVSTTGIAGPGGATDTKPVGLFYLGLSTIDETKVMKYIFPGNREQVKQKATDLALAILNGALIEHICRLENISLDEKHVVTCFLEHEGEILILRRSRKVGTYRGAWAGVSGYMEHDALSQAYIEIKEETGLARGDIELMLQGEPLTVLDLDLRRKWCVHPFLFHVKDPARINIDWEHTESKWIRPASINKYKTVPGLGRALDLVWP